MAEKGRCVGEGQARIFGFRIVDQDGDAVEFEVTTREGVMTALANLRLDGDKLVLYNLHVDGQGKGKIGPEVLRAIIRSFMEDYDVAFLEIHGFRRTTGARQGRTPRPRRFRRCRQTVKAH